MIQNAIKILTLGFFISMISGFVMYRMDYFDSTKTAGALHASPNGGELLNANGYQDSLDVPQINQKNQVPIMPSSKSAVPVIDMESMKQDQKKAILPSSKSFLHPIEFKPEESERKRIMSSSKSIIIDPFESQGVSSKMNREAIKVQPELIPSDTSIEENSAENEEDESPSQTKVKESQSDEELNVPKSINWSGIALGVLGILFVGIGSIVYFKRRSK